MSDGREAKLFSIIAMLVSALSFLAASGQTWLMYQHNRVSVMPKLDWRVDYGDGDRLTLDLFNAGLGPAKVSNVKIDVNGVIYSLNEAAACSVVDEIVSADHTTAKGAKCFEMSEDDWVFVKPGDSLTLYATGQQAGIESYNIESLGIQARYCSLYDQCEDL